MGQFYVKGVYSRLGLKSALIFFIDAAPFRECLAFSDSFPIQAENLIKHETHIMSLSSILPMEMAVANVSNIMERVISRSSFKK